MYCEMGLLFLDTELTMFTRQKKSIKNIFDYSFYEKVKDHITEAYVYCSYSKRNIQGLVIR